MEAATMAYAVLIAGGLVNIQPMTLSDCDAQAAKDQTTLCVMIEEPCVGEDDCGIEVKASKSKPKKKHYRYKRKSAYQPVTVGQILARAM